MPREALCKATVQLQAMGKQACSRPKDVDTSLHAGHTSACWQTITGGSPLPLCPSPSWSRQDAAAQDCPGRHSCCAESQGPWICNSTQKLEPPWPERAEVRQTMHYSEHLSKSHLADRQADLAVHMPPPVICCLPCQRDLTGGVSGINRLPQMLGPSSMPSGIPGQAAL